MNKIHLNQHSSSRIYLNQIKPYRRKRLTVYTESLVSPEVRQYIEETLLLPIAAIKPFVSNT